MSATAALTSSSPLRIAVLGAGKIGSTFAFQLALTGRHDLTVTARPGSARMQQLEQDAAIVNIKGERASVQVASSLDEQTPYDLVIVTLLAHQIDAVLPAIQRCAARCILFMFNIFQPERLQEAVGTERCAFGMPFVQALLETDGKLKVTIGAGGQKTLLSQRRWVDVFVKAGLPATLKPDMPLWLRCHVPLCVRVRKRQRSWDEAPRRSVVERSAGHSPWCPRQLPPDRGSRVLSIPDRRGSSTVARR